jgi:hypothetical protein
MRACLKSKKVLLMILSMLLMATMNKSVMALSLHPPFAQMSLVVTDPICILLK